MTQQFEFRNYGEDAAGTEVVEYRRYSSDQGAKTYAGRLSRRISGPVDIARAGGAEWHERYVTTVSPSEYHAAGYRFERLT